MDLVFSSSDEEDDNPVATLSISEQSANKNYEQAALEVPEEPDQLSLENNSHLLCDNVNLSIMELLEEVQLPYKKLADFQLLSLHVLGSRRNLILISPTRSGKMLVVQLAPLLLRKIMKVPRGVAVGTQPLTIIMEEKLKTSFIPVGVVTMSGELKMDLEEAELSDPESDFLEGKMPVIIGHPESWKSTTGQKLIRKMHKKGIILMNFLDEWHTHLDGHWADFHPDMKVVCGQLRIFSLPGAPTLATTATATDSEIKSFQANMRFLEKPIVLKASPIQEHFKFVCLKRPSNVCGADGRIDKSGKYNPGLLKLLERIYLKHFIQGIKHGIPVKKAIIFYRTEHQMLDTQDFLQSKLPECTDFLTKPWVTNNSGMGKVTTEKMMERRNEITLFLSTTKMLLGVDLENISIIIFVRVLNRLHYIPQGAGRAGRRNQTGNRQKVLVYILHNSSDVAANVPGLTEEVKMLCKTEMCLKTFLKRYFDGPSSQDPGVHEWYCNNRDLALETMPLAEAN